MSANSASQAGRPFNLVRYFVIASLVAIAGVAVISSLVFGTLMRRSLVHEAEGDAIAVARLMVAEFNAELEALLPYLEHRQVRHKPGETHILITSDMLDNPQFLEIIEGEGCQIVMDDLDTGSRYFNKLVDEENGDAIATLARRYTWRPADPSAYNWEEQIQQMIEWVRDFRADGVIELYDEFSPPRQWRVPLLIREMARQNIPLLRIGRGYDVGNVGQLQTRVGAFLEMLGTTA